MAKKAAKKTAKPAPKVVKPAPKRVALPHGAIVKLRVAYTPEDLMAMGRVQGRRKLLRRELQEYLLDLCQKHLREARGEDEDETPDPSVVEQPATEEDLM